MDAEWLYLDQMVIELTIEEAEELRTFLHLLPGHQKTALTDKISSDLDGLLFRRSQRI